MTLAFPPAQCETASQGPEARALHLAPLLPGPGCRVPQSPVKGHCARPLPPVHSHFADGNTEPQGAFGLDWKGPPPHLSHEVVASPSVFRATDPGDEGLPPSVANTAMPRLCLYLFFDSPFLQYREERGCWSYTHFSGDETEAHRG